MPADTIRMDCARWAFYNLGARMCAVDTGLEHGPDRPAIIAHRFWCPSCDAPAGEPCRLSAKFTQEWSHESRHQVACRADWQRMALEVERGMGYVDSLGFVR